jgi:hypothetical protein
VLTHDVVRAPGDEARIRELDDLLRRASEFAGARQEDPRNELEANRPLSHHQKTPRAES